jgi:hypothetical protein
MTDGAFFAVLIGFRFTVIRKRMSVVREFEGQPLGQPGGPILKPLRCFTHESSRTIYLKFRLRELRPREMTPATIVFRRFLRLPVAVETIVVCACLPPARNGHESVRPNPFERLLNLETFERRSRRLAPVHDVASGTGHRRRGVVNTLFTE